MDEILRSTKLTHALNTYGDRSNSWVTSYPDFDQIGFEDGIIRYSKSNSAWVAASEPLAPRHKRANYLVNFAQQAKLENKRMLVAPISESLALELEKKGYDILPVGSEPIFDLAEYFTGDRDPIQSFSSTKTMKSKGFYVVQKQISEVTQVELQAMKELYQKWKINRSSSQMGFLSKVDPFMAESAKTYFILKKNSSPEIFAFLTGLPVLPKKGMYFSDWIRPIQTKPGIMEYLLIESMRILFSNHYKEVRLGIAPLAHLSSDDFKGVRKKLYFKLMQTCFHKLKYPYSFNGLFQFKSKLEPTSWEKLFIATDKKIGLKQLFDLYSVHFKVSFVESFYNNMREKYLTRHTHLVAPKSISDLTNRIKATLVITLSMLALHLVTQFFDFASNWHAKSGFVANGFNYFGYITGPVFHDNTYHLLGDLGTFLLLGGLVELYLGMPVLLILTTLGFWATNPIAIELLKFVNEFNLLSSDSFYKTLLERDYGSSNAIYAFAGALALLTVRPNFILIPFIINGFLICLGRGSYLAIHHWVGLFLGVAFLKFYHLYKAR